ncbi:MULTISPECIES: hypothetical protein [Hydrocarboniphaga]|uniref:Lipoprotein n=1 Tax=Hydrocarboniphaga effusa AP103 TaxID=1172194 RepID=I8I2L6_9GAMM|nr:MULTISPECIES: hypothetical protein [Hydrocarboniphaga]EIT69954.1 hypothetical protein WQQ_00910 [Hydrocarboniphaga effusa AP103]EIT70141.1 hypothetical protein WQQ_02780 [Hydrocarboniphaga effusa AP103]MDZ4078536.1 hypothetical protein [Hydrocarboniphaga sp.]
MNRQLVILTALFACGLLGACATQPKTSDSLSALEVEQGWNGSRCVNADLDVPSPEGTRFVLRRALGCIFPTSGDRETTREAAAL